MRTAALLISAVLVILLMPAAIEAIDGFRLQEYTNDFNVTTGGGVTTATVTLSQPLYGDETRNAVVSSNLTTDAPIASTYIAATKVLTVIGLQASQTHRLSVEFKIDRLGDYFGAGIGAKVWPLLLILGTLGIIAGAIYTATRKED